MSAGEQIVVESAVGDLAHAQLLHHIHQGEILRNGNVLRAIARAIVACSARNVDILINRVDHARYQLRLLFAERLKILHIADIVGNLFHIAHTAQHHHHIG